MLTDAERAPSLARMPLSAPAWLWLGYAAVIVALGLLTGSALGALMVGAAAGFSFQFWTFAAWRGLSRAAKPTTEEAP